MAHKPLDQLSPAYRRRIERAEAKGLTRQAARGHKPREHVRRAEYQRKQHAGLTTPQMRAIKNFYENPEYTQKRYVKLKDLEYLAVVNGYAAFQEYRAAWRKANKSYKINGYIKGRFNADAIRLYAIVDEIYEPNDKLYYYH